MGTDGCTQRGGKYQHAGNLSVLDGARRRRWTARWEMYYSRGSSQLHWYGDNINHPTKSSPTSSVTVVPSSTAAAAGRRHAEGHSEEKMSRGTKSACGTSCSLPGPQSSRHRTSQFCIDKAFKHELNHIGTQLIGNVEAECELTSFDRSHDRHSTDSGIPLTISDL